MEIRVITVGKLPSFIEEAGFLQSPHLPITPLRAFSQAKNPNSEANDPALIIAYNEDNEVLAYFGCLPDKLQENKTEKVCWSSCWWAHPTKGQAASMPVFYKGLQVWNAKMLFDALPEQSAAVLEKMGYFSFQEIGGIHAFVRFKLHKIIPSRIPFFAPLKNVFYVFDTLLNIPLQLRFAFKKWEMKMAKSLSVEQVSEVGKEAEEFIHSLSKSEIIDRSRQQFNWIIQHPWLSPNKSFTRKYFFSSHADHFEHILLKVRKDKKMIAFLWISLRDGTARLPYCYIEPRHEDAAAKVIIEQLIKQSVDTFICFQQNILSALAKQNAPFLYKKEVSKTFAWTKTLDTYFAEPFYVQDGDGDTSFT